MNSLPTIAFALIALSSAVQAVFLLKGGGRQDRASRWLLLAAALLLLATSVARSLAIGFPALTGTFESLVFYAALVCLVVFAYRVQGRLPQLPLVGFGATVVALVLLAVASSPLAPKEALAPVPALKSGWLVLHVSFTFVGEAFFVASFVSALAFLLSRDEEKRLAYDRLTYTAVALGFPVFTAGALVFGAIWAERAWGSWWSWDPKETWGRRRSRAGAGANGRGNWSAFKAVGSIRARLEVQNSRMQRTQRKRKGRKTIQKPG